ncbi:hypothetical protein J2Y83_005252 [Pseudomonas marginalis]|uniref:hypothetical protein n=1 Tax=Pseudomonas marginalis TaxID=298 RepID=UPI00209E49BF|nr:hypothetical protein [Pseudomonas marginalis]MCP1509278.1 hypothetical protein [Pseudomonas marginalis]MCP1526783.1 hypothetical protein [Pseudomonas marginalis]MDQ0501956.1 hypothetical protein [Pseudomonas marginalis]
MDAVTRHLPRLRWQLMQWQQRLGVPGLLALGVMAAALAIDVAIIYPAGRSDDLRRQELQAGIAEHPQEVQVTEPAVVERLPSAEDFAPRLEKLLGILTQRGFIIEQTTLAYSAPGDTGLQRLDAEIPLVGPYILLRETLADLAKEPAVRIENVTLERKEITSGMLSIGLKVSVLGVVE